tara:strand:- start:3400 stop:3585 length:186 start_codon:yes stop_codon:yes gene_type:complete
MCLICIDLKRQKLTSVEARRNLSEVCEKMEEEHIIEVIEKIWIQEDKEFDEFQEYMKVCEK